MNTIFGIFSSDNSTLDPVEINKMHEAQKIGPYEKELQLFLGHATFSQLIQDKEMDQHYLANSLLGIYVFADIKFLSNKEELSSQLNIKSEKNITLIYEAYQRWGTKCTDFLVGDFQVVVYDQRYERVYLINRYLSGSILYYMQHVNKFYFSDLQVSLHASLVPISKNLEKAFDIFLFEYQRSSETFYKPIFQLPYGAQLIFEKSCISIQRFWKPKKNPEYRCLSFEAAGRKLNELLHTVVKEYVDAAPSIASQISGGLDSSTICCIAAKYVPTIKAFCEIPKNNDFLLKSEKHYNSEEPFVKAIAEFYPNIELHFLHGADSKLNLLNLTDYFEQYKLGVSVSPLNIPWIIKNIELCEEQNIRSLLTGFAGNHTSSWSGCYSLFLQRLGNIVRFRRSLKIFFNKKKTERVLFSKKIRLSNYNLISDILFYGKYPAANLAVANNVLSEYSSFFKPLCFKHKLDMPVPLMDPRIIDFCFSLPLSYFRKKSRSRLLIREATKNLLPDSVRLLTKRGLQNAGWLENAIIQATHMKTRFLELTESYDLTPYFDVSLFLSYLTDLCVLKIEEIRNFSSTQADVLRNKYQREMLPMLHLAEWIVRGNEEN